MSSARSSPSPPSDVDEPRGLRSKQVGKDASSLKRVREGSLEPGNTSNPTAAAVTTKKNRLATLASEGKQGPKESVAEAEDITEVDTPAEVDESGEAEQDPDAKNRKGAPQGPEGRTVGEVRRKVEKMTYEEGHQAAVEGQYGGQGEGETVEKDESESSGTAGDGLKRKALDRSESSFAHEEEDAAVKRQKDTPPPETADANTDAVSVKKPQTSFSSFASSSSPFAALKSPSPAPGFVGESTTVAAQPSKKPQTTFGSLAGRSSPFASATPPPPTAPSPAPAPDPAAGAGAGASTLQAEEKEKEKEKEAAAHKKPQATFGAFSSSSPFGGAKAGSAFGSTPSKGSAFGNYSTSASAFGTNKSESGQGGKQAGPSAFGDILQERKDDDATEAEAKVQMQEQDVSTGEEDEETVYQTRAKLYFSDKASGAWKERGVGLLKLNVRQVDALGARLVMRSDGVYSLLLNAKLYKGLNPHVDGKIVRMSIMQGSEFALITLRLSNPKVAAELAEHIHQHVPLTDADALTPGRESV